MIIENMISLRTLEFWLPLIIAGVSLALNIFQIYNYKRVRNKISIWARDAKGMLESLKGMRENIQHKKITSLSDVSSHLNTLENFAVSMSSSMNEEIRGKRG